MKIFNIHIRFSDLFIWLAVIAIDIFIFLFLGLLLMGYEDNYEISKGEYLSLSSMNNQEKGIYISYNIWVGLHILFFAYIGFLIVKRIVRTTK